MLFQLFAIDVINDHTVKINQIPLLKKRFALIVQTHLHLANSKRIQSTGLFCLAGHNALEMIFQSSLFIRSSGTRRSAHRIKDRSVVARVRSFSSFLLSEVELEREGVRLLLLLHLFLSHSRTRRRGVYFTNSPVCPAPSTLGSRCIPRLEYKLRCFLLRALPQTTRTARSLPLMKKPVAERRGCHRLRPESCQTHNSR